MGITREKVWLQETPQGTMAIGCLEAEDMQRVVAGLATSQNPFDQWWRAQIPAMHGVNLSQLLPGPPNEQILDFSHG